MVRRRVCDSVIPWLVACLIVGGLAVAVGWWWVQRSHTEALLRIEVTRQLASATRDLQAVLRQLDDDADAARHAMSVFALTQQVRAMRLRRAGEAPIVLGEWPASLPEGTQTWSFRVSGDGLAHEVSLDHPTIVRAPFPVGRHTQLLEMLVDGPSLRARHEQAMKAQLVDDVLLVAILTLLVLLLLRRRIALPLAEVVELVRVGGKAETFAALSRRQRGEFRELAAVIGQTLDALQRANATLADREQALEALYQLAPAAMLSIDPDGRIIEANQAAGDLLAEGSPQSLLGRPVVDLLQVEDRPLLPQAVDRLRTQETVRCHLRVRHAPGYPLIHTAVQAAALRDEAGRLHAVRLALTDVTPLKRLQDQLEEKTRLLDLLVDHMADAVVLTDEAGVVVASNQQASRLLSRSGGSLLGQTLTQAGFWESLGPEDSERWVQRLQAVVSQPERVFRERLQTQAGVMQVEATPVRDAGGAAGRLWLIQDAGLQEQSERQLVQHKQQLQALRRIGPSLVDARSVDALLERMIERVYAEMGADAVGAAIRHGDRGRRAKQLIHRGGGSYLLAQHAELAQVIENGLVPHVLGHPEALHWPDLSIVTTPWANAFVAAGLTALAAAPVRGAAETAGVLWIARRGGEPIEPRQIHLLETLCPLFAARLEMAQLSERLQGLHLVDPVTDLPSHLQFERAMHKMVGRPGQPCAMLVIDLDGFTKLNETFGRAGGDHVLRVMAGRLLAGSRKHAFVARFAGAAFGLIVPEVGASQLQGLAERMRGLIGGEPVTLPGGESCRVTATVGAACFPDDALRADDLLDLAVLRVGAAQRAGVGVVSSGPGAARRAG